MRETRRKKERDSKREKEEGSEKDIRREKIITNEKDFKEMSTEKKRFVSRKGGRKL